MAYPETEPTLYEVMQDREHFWCDGADLLEQATSEGYTLTGAGDWAVFDHDAKRVERFELEIAADTRRDQLHEAMMKTAKPAAADGMPRIWLAQELVDFDLSSVQVDYVGEASGDDE